MGMSASQARFLTITSRMNDIEFKSQQISNVKIRLADESDQVAQEYTNALNKQQLTFKQFDQNGNAYASKLDGKSLLADGDAVKAGYELVKYDGSAHDIKNLGSLTATQVYELIESGNYILRRTTVDENKNSKTENVSVSSDVNLAIVSDDQTNIAKAEAEYNAKSARINRKEKLLDQDLKALDTEHNALKTEMDSIKSLIGNNIEKTFNLFS